MSELLNLSTSEEGGEIANEASLQASFVDVLSRICTCLAMANIQVKTYSDVALEKFNSLSIEERLRILERSKVYLTICVAVIESGDSLLDNNRFVWHALKQMRYLPSDDFFLKLNNDDVVELYSEDYVQLFRSFNFFKYCSYSMADIFVFPWYALFYRSEALNSSIFEKVGRYMAERTKGTFDPDIEEHIAYEIFSEEKFFIKMKAKYFSIFKNAKASEGDALVIISTCALTDSKQFETSH